MIKMLKIILYKTVTNCHGLKIQGKLQLSDFFGQLNNELITIIR